MHEENIVIIGGGAAGLMAAIAAGEADNNVVLLEKNSELGKKIKISGGGRCNVTNDKEPPTFLENVISNPKFLLKSLWTFTSQDLITFFESKGCRLKVEDNDHVFPVSEDPQELVNIFKNELKKRNIQVYFKAEVIDINTYQNQVVSVKLANNDTIPARAVIVATGGISYPETGSTGTGHQIAKKLGHQIVPLKPALVGIEIKEKWITEMTGISFQDIEASTTIEGKTVTVQGDLLITHAGLSGPSAYKLSSHLTKANFSQEGHTVYINFFPQFSFQELEHQLMTYENSKKHISTILTTYWPKKFALEVLNKLNIEKDTKMNQITKTDRHNIITAMKNFQITAWNLQSIKQATVTSGGIAVKQVDPSTMESKLINGLYFAGEILDVDALTGGYNLQIAFSTGYVAGGNCVE